MAEPKYVMQADEPLYKRVPWWVWVLGLGALVLMVSRRKGARREFEDYLA